MRCESVDSFSQHEDLLRADYFPELFCYRGNEHTGERCTVADDKHVRFQDEIWSLTALAKHLLGTRNSVAGLSISNTTARG